MHFRRSIAEKIIDYITYALFSYGIVYSISVLFIHITTGENWLQEWFQATDLFYVVISIPGLAGISGIFFLLTRSIYIKVSLFFLLIYQVTITIMNMISFTFQGTLTTPMLFIALVICFIYIYYTKFDFCRARGYHKSYDEYYIGYSSERED